MLVRVQFCGTTSVKVAKLKGTVLHCPPVSWNGVCCPAEPADQLNVNAVVLAGDVALQMVRFWIPADAPPPPQRVVPNTIATTNVANRNAQETVVRTVTLSSSIQAGFS